jgi:hypothetical protein
MFYDLFLEGFIKSNDIRIIKNKKQSYYIVKFKSIINNSHIFIKLAFYVSLILFIFCFFIFFFLKKNFFFNFFFKIYSKLPLISNFYKFLRIHMLILSYEK